MKLTQLCILLITSLGLSVLGSCATNNSSGNPAATPSVASSASQPTPAPSVTSGSSPSSAKPAQEHNHGGQGGQVIETGVYHLELITVNEPDGTHIDFFLQKGDAHQPVSTAKVTAQVQLPDGNQKAFDLKYDASGKHYYAVLPGTTVGEYKVAILSDIQGEKVNARYTFKR